MLFVCKWYQLTMLCSIHTYIRHGRNRMEDGFTTTYAISAHLHNVVSSNPAHGEVYSIQHYVIESFRSVVFNGYSCSPTSKTDRHDITDILLKVALNNTLTLTLNPCKHHLWDNKTNLTSPLCIEVPMLSYESERFCNCVLGLSILLLSIGIWNDFESMYFSPFYQYLKGHPLLSWSDSLNWHLSPSSLIGSLWLGMLYWNYGSR